MAMKKVVTFSSKGVDQLGVQVGKPQPGDVVMLHVKGWYTAQRPLFKLGKKKFAEKQRAKEFLDTRRVGSTAFVEIEMRKEPISSPSNLIEILTFAAQGMTFGEAAEFTMEASMIKDLEARDALCKGQYKWIASDAGQLYLKIDCTRIKRGMKHHHRPVRATSHVGCWNM